MRKCVVDMGAGIGFLVLAVGFGVQMGELSGVSRVFPQSLAIFVGIGGLYFILKGCLALLRGQGGIEEGDPVVWPRVCIISILAVGYALVIKTLGFFSSTFIFLFLAFMILGNRKVSMARRVCIGILFAVVFCLCIWGGFVKLLNVPTPTGLLF